MASWERGSQQQTKTQNNSQHFQCIKGSSVTAPCNGLWSSCHHIWLSACQNHWRYKAFLFRTRNAAPTPKLRRTFFWDKRRDRARWFQIPSRHLQLPRYFTQTMLRCFIGHQWSKIHIQLKTTHGFLSLKKSGSKLSLLEQNTFTLVHHWREPNCQE